MTSVMVLCEGISRFREFNKILLKLENGLCESKT